MEGPRVKDAAVFTTIAIWNMILTQTRIAAKDRDEGSDLACFPCRVYL